MAIRKSSSSGIPFGNTAGRPTSQTGQPYFNGEIGRLELYTNTGWQNIVQETPGVASVTGIYSEASNSGTLTINGTNFTSGAIASAIGTNGVEIQATTTTFNSILQLTAVFTGLANQYEPYDIKVTNPSNLFGLLPDSFFINASPVWQTASGSLGTFEEVVAVSVSATATDSDSESITYSVTSGALPSGVTLNSSTGLISGTLPNILSNTTYTFVITATDGVNNIPRSFSITSVANLAPVWSTASGLIATITEGMRESFSYNLAATDNENNTLTYALVSGSLPPNMNLSSSGVISGITPQTSTTTNYPFTVSVSDRLNTVTRNFSLTINAVTITTFSSVGSTTWTAPAGVNNIRLLMVGGAGGGGNDRGNGPGGGGGSGGIVYHPSASVTPGTTYNLVIGRGGLGANANNQSGGSGCTTTGFGAVAGSGGGGVSEYANNCNQTDSTTGCGFSGTSSVSGATSGASIVYNGGSGGCSFGAQGTSVTYTTDISGSSYTYGGINNGPGVYGGGGVKSNSNGGNGVIVIAY